VTSTAVGRRRLTGRRRLPTVTVVTIGLVLILTLSVAALCVGDPMLSPGDALGFVFVHDGSPTAIVVHTLRLPRAVLAIGVGAALAVAGVIMQALTRNPLADPGILGVNAGASFAVALAFVVVGATDFGATLAFAFAGAAVTSVVVALLGAVGRTASITRLALAGVAVGAALSGFTQALSLIDPQAYSRIRVWEAGSLAARGVDTAGVALAVIAVGLLVAFASARGLNLLIIGEEHAHALGARVARVRLSGFVAIVLLCGTATATVGPVGFIGLMIPHAVRIFSGADQVRALLYSALAGPVVVLTADLVARTVIAPQELPLGVVTAFVGAPVLIALVQRHRARGAS
jgi:iron complex transport system permease protein